MKIFLIFLVAIIIFFIFKKTNYRKSKNETITKFKNKLISKESRIEKIYLRDDEITSSDPNININIGINENEDKINRKSNIHRARLAKFKKSKLNGEMIYLDSKQKIYKLFKGNKIYL